MLDPVHPRKLCLGYKAWPSSIMWHQSHRWNGAETPKDTYTMVLGIADQRSGLIKAVWLDGVRFTVGNTAGASGHHFVPASNFAGQFAELQAADWYVPNIERFASDPVLNHWGRRENNGDWHVAVSLKYYDGSQTSPDDRLEQLPGFASSGGSAKNRVFSRITYLAISFRAGLTTRGDGGDFGGADVGPHVPTVLVESEGNRDVYDWRIGTGAYTRNGVLCMAHWMRWEYGPLAAVDDTFATIYPLASDFDTTHMQDEADLCDGLVQAGTTGQTQPRYTVDAEIEASMGSSQAFDQFSFALGGVKVFRQRSDGKWRIRCGRYVAPGFNLVENDYRPTQIRTQTRLPRQERKNTVQVKYYRPEAGYQMVDAPLVTDSDYVVADNGRQRVQSFEALFLAGVPTGTAYTAARAHRLGLIWLDKHRLERVHHMATSIGAGIDNGVQTGACRLEIGDALKLTNDRYGYDQQEFVVTTVGYDPQAYELGFVLRETGAGIVRYDGITSDREPGPEDPATHWGVNELAAVTGLVASVMAGSADLQADGTIWVQTLLDWDDHPDVRVSDLGQYRLEYKRSTETKFSSITSVASRNEVRTQQGNTYNIRVRPETPFGRGDWATLTFTPQTLIYGQENFPNMGMLPDPLFLQPYDSAVGDGLYYGTHLLTNADSAGDTVVASVKVLEGGGYWSVIRGNDIVTTRARLLFSGGDTGDSHRFYAKTYVPVRVGQTVLGGVSMAFETPGQLKVTALFYNSSRVFITGSEVALVDQTSATPGAGGGDLGLPSGSNVLGLPGGANSMGLAPLDWVYAQGTTVAAAVGGIKPSFVRLQIMQVLTAEAVPQTISIDGLVLNVT